ncbi:hypothetical protein ACVOMV_17505 [Mesorhizobium atlanticum]
MGIVEPDEAVLVVTPILVWPDTRLVYQRQPAALEPNSLRSAAELCRRDHRLMLRNRPAVLVQCLSGVVSIDKTQPIAAVGSALDERHPVLLVPPLPSGADDAPISEDTRSEVTGLDSCQHLLAPSFRRKLAHAGKSPKLVPPGEQPHVLKAERQMVGGLGQIGRRQHFARARHHEIAV